MPLKTEEVEAILLAHASGTVSFSPGEALLEEGQRSGRMYLIVRGEVAIEREGEAGHVHRIATRGQGNLLGDMSVLRGDPHSATVRAIVATEALEISADFFDKMTRKRKTPLEHLLYETSTRLSDFLAQSTDASLELMKKELKLAQLRNAMATFLVAVMLGLTAYAVLMRHLTETGVRLSNAMVVSGPLLFVMATAALLYIRYGGLPREIFGLRLLPEWRREVGEAILASVPVLILLTLAKWLLVRSDPSAVVFPVFAGPFRAGSALIYLLYAALVPVQELLARGVIQGPLLEFLPGSARRRWFWSILVSNALFGLTHLHLTIAYAAAAAAGGVLWGTLFARRRSLLGPSVSHILVGVYALYFLGLADVLKALR